MARSQDQFLTSSCPDLFRASMTFLQGLRQGFVEVVPIGVLRDDEIDLPGARPVLHGPFPLDGGGDFVVAFRVDEAGTGRTAW